MYFESTQIKYLRARQYHGRPESPEYIDTLESVAPAARYTLYGWKPSELTGPILCPRKLLWYRITLSCSPRKLKTLITCLADPHAMKGACLCSFFYEV